MSRIDRVNPEKFFQRREENEAFLFMPSKFNFLNDHKGLRPGCVHVLLSTTGGGKSTLVMSLIEEMLEAKKDIFVYSSEETVRDLETKMSYLKSGGNEHRLRVLHESAMLDLCGKDLTNVEDFLHELQATLIQTLPSVFIFDNITTSVFYDQNEKAMQVAMGLKRISEETEIPFVIVAHTTSSVSQNEFFESSKIRGFRSIVNTAQYVYCLMRLRVDVGCGQSQDATIIYTDKSRNHPVASRSFYRIFYNVETRIFTSDIKIKYEDFKRFLKGTR